MDDQYELIEDDEWDDDEEWTDDNSWAEGEQPEAAAAAQTAATGAGRLYVVAVPIGHPDDITARAVALLSSVSAIVCEEVREGGRLLRSLGIDKPLLPLNEHNEREAAPAIVAMLKAGESLALISDAGTPLFSDPGRVLLTQCAGAGIGISPAPGPSSLMAALSVCDFELKRWLFAGFLARDSARRRLELRELRGTNLPVVLMDAPYRMPVLLEDVSRVYGGKQVVMLPCDLTLPEERIYRGAVDTVRRQCAGRKSEFVLVVATAGEDHPSLAGEKPGRQPRTRARRH